MRKNPAVDTDAYKLTHWLQSPKDLTKLYSYGEPRVGGKYPFISYFGLQIIIKDHFLEMPTKEMIDEAEEESFLTFGTKEYFNRPVWEAVRRLGYYPVKIKSVPEGMKVPINNVVFTLESTSAWFASTLNGAFESTLMHVWYPTTVATRAMYIKERITPYFIKTSEIPAIVLPVAVNDFGYRGATGHEAAARGGAAFLVHFVGSDNMAANRLIKDYYGYKGRIKSVWATEHSVATSYGLSPENELEYMIAQLERSNPDSIISIVIDSKDSDNFVRNIVGNERVKGLIKARSGRVVLRPDSGDPKINIIKYLDMLGGIFGYRINSVSGGYKVINDNIGLIQGDGMNEETIPELYEEVTKAGWAADNFITGSGGGLLQVDANRDTSRWAIKASYGERDGVGFDIQKDPKTDETKKSKAGRLKLHPAMGIPGTKMRGLSTVSSVDHSTFDSYVDVMETVYEDGKFNEQSFESVLRNAAL